MSKILRLLGCILLLGNLITACAAHTKDVYYTRDGEYVEVERETHTDEHPGAVSSTVGAVGDVVAAPFRLIGSAFRALF